MTRFEPFWHTTVPLTANASIGYPNANAAGTGTTYTGVMDAARIVGSVYSDQAGTLTIHWSSDAGTNHDIPDTTINVSATTATYINVEVRLPFCQIVYLNGGTGQNTFRLFLYLTDRLSNLTVT